MDERTLQALRNITREHMRSLKASGLSDAEVREITCVQEALRMLFVHNFKQDRPR